MGFSRLSDKEDNHMAENNMDVLTVNRTYKSRIFAMLFSDRNELLKLYILKAVMLNINKDHNRKLMEICRTLHDYAEYASRLRRIHFPGT